MSSLALNAVLLEISKQLADEQLDNLKFLCGNMIGKRELEKVKNGTKLFQLLMERNKLGADTTEYLSELLEKIGRDDLSDKLKNFQSECGHTDNQPDETEKAKLNIATEVIVENLGKNWRKMGRKLHLSEVKLESISARHPGELEEMVVEMLKQWRKSRGAEASAKELIGALRACDYNLTADKVEDRLKDCGY
uniref:FAS-associated death domain protein n=1 Tax=Monopterus albus TaxID=43700 RepID=A0A3Q3QR87_MONAL|nr:FAS-associated death domain protein [Monopterus albus]